MAIDQKETVYWTLLKNGGWRLYIAATKKRSGNMSRHKFKTKQIKRPKKGNLKKTHSHLTENGR